MGGQREVGISRASRKKDVTPVDTLRSDEIKNRNPTIKILPGFVARARVRCGKSNCRCTRGARHVAYYRVTHSHGLRFRQYVRRNQVEEMREACQAHRTLQAQLRAGRAEYKRTLARARELVKMLNNE
jgi:hypothetical protein